jgi:hypothetical protein
MCPPCRREYIAELADQRRVSRRDPIREAVIVEEVDRIGAYQVMDSWQHRQLEASAEPIKPVQPVMVKVRPVVTNRPAPRKPRVFTEEETLEIGRRYEAGETYVQIQQATGASTNQIAEIARSLGWTKTKGPKPKVAKPQDFIDTSLTAQPGEAVFDLKDAVPEPQQKAIERMIVLPPKPEPLHSTPMVAAPLDWDVRGSWPHQRASREYRRRVERGPSTVSRPANHGYQSGHVAGRECCADLTTAARKCHHLLVGQIGSAHSLLSLEEETE